MFHLFTSPETATYIQKLEKEKRDKAAGQTQDNRSFLAKYVSFFFLHNVFDNAQNISFSLWIKLWHTKNSTMYCILYDTFDAADPSSIASL